jgi:hypothetical protein
MFFGLIGHIQAVWFVKWTLFVRIHIDEAFDALLAHISPAVTTHPFALAQRAFELSETTFFTLIRRQTFSFGSSLD